MADEEIFPDDALKVMFPVVAVLTILVPAVSNNSVSLTISGVPLDDVIKFCTCIVSTTNLLVTNRSFSTLRSLSIVTPGVIIILLLSVVSMIRPTKVKLPS